MTQGDTHPAAQENRMVLSSVQIANDYYNVGACYAGPRGFGDGPWVFQSQLTAAEQHIERLQYVLERAAEQQAGLEARVTHLTQERDVLSVKERREFAWAEEYMQLSRTLTLKVEALQAELTTLHREQAALVERMRLWRARFTPDGRDVIAATAMINQWADELAALLPTSLSQEPSDP